MNKKTIVLMISIIILIIMLILGIKPFISWLFTKQYNSKGISHFLVITIDKNQPKEYIGKLEDYDIYVEKLKLDELNFRSVDAKNVPLKDAIENKLVSIEDWRKYARKTRKEGDIEILQNENYEIAISDKDCLIRPITK